MRARLALQHGLDKVVLSWVIVWIWIGMVVKDGVGMLAELGRRISASTADLSDLLSDAGSALDDVATPFDKASEASASMGDAGDAAARAAEKVAFCLGLAHRGRSSHPPRGAPYLTGRVRWIREASAGLRVLDGPANLEVFALRAITNQPLGRLARITADPLGALRRGDVAVVSAVARLELDAAGLAAPALGVAGSTP